MFVPAGVGGGGGKQTGSEGRRGRVGDDVPEGMGWGCAETTGVMGGRRHKLLDFGEMG